MEFFSLSAFQIESLGKNGPVNVGDELNYRKLSHYTSVLFLCCGFDRFHIQISILL